MGSVASKKIKKKQPTKRKRKPATKNEQEFSVEWCRHVLRQIEHSLGGLRNSHSMAIGEIARFVHHADAWATKDQVSLIEKEFQASVRRIRRLARKELVRFQDLLDALKDLSAPQVNEANEELFIAQRGEDTK